MIPNSAHAALLISPSRNIVSKVGLYNGSTLLNTFLPSGALKNYTVTRTGDKKFFGYGVTQKIELHLVDKARAINVEKGQKLVSSFGIDNSFIPSACPPFYISDVKRDENTNELTIIGEDLLAQMKTHTVSELNLVAPYTIATVVQAIGDLFGIGVTFEGDMFYLEYAEGANVEGTENLRDILDDIAEATQTIYAISNSSTIDFRRLNKTGAANLTINKSDYFTLTGGQVRTLKSIVRATELGDNIESAITEEGETQYLRDNPFLDDINNVASIIDQAIAEVGGTAITEFTCKWRGNYLLEIGDKLDIVTKDNGILTTYLLDGSFTYNGGLNEEISWEYKENEAETANHPTALGDVLKQTLARVDKINREIELVASDGDATKQEIANIIITTESITNTVTNIEKTTSENFENVNEEIAELKESVETKLTKDDFTILVKDELENGVNQVVTNTGYKFNDEGLTVSKSNSEMTTQISDDGMKVFKNNEEMLVANNTGVKATNLHATTYLIVGRNSRFEDYVQDGEERTGCFWIGV